MQRGAKGNTTMDHDRTSQLVDQFLEKRLAVEAEKDPEALKERMGECQAVVEELHNYSAE